MYDGGGQLVAEYTAFLASDPAPTPQVSYLTQDHLGSTRVITNNLGQVIKRSDYMAYGDDVITANRSSANGYEQPSETRKGYTGYERDIESGLDFAQARYYNPQHGRFTSIDPLTASANVKDPQTFNRYTYALNSPYKFTDPLGLVSVTTGAWGQWGPGSGDYVDGSAFRGRDTSFDWANFEPHASDPEGGQSSSGGGSSHGSSEVASDAPSAAPPAAPSDDPPNLANRSCQTSGIATACTQSQPDKYFEVSGANAQEAVDNAIMNCGGVDAYACTDTDIAVTVWPQKKGNGQIGAGKVLIVMTFTTTLPKWTGYANASDAEKAKWDAFVAKRKSHENIHVSIGQNSVMKLAIAVSRSPSAKTVLKFEESWRNSYNVELKKMRDLNLLFDSFDVFWRKNWGETQPW